MYHLFFQKFQLKCFLTNVLWDCKRSISFLVQLLWGSVWTNVFSFQLHIVSYFQSLWILSLLVKLPFIASFAISIDFMASSQLLCNLMRNSSNFENSICTIRFLFLGYLPKLSLNGVCPVTICFLSLYWNSTAASYSIQSSHW